MRVRCSGSPSCARRPPASAPPSLCPTRHDALASMVGDCGDDDGNQGERGELKRWAHEEGTGHREASDTDTDRRRREAVTHALSAPLAQRAAMTEPAAPTHNGNGANGTGAASDATVAPAAAPSVAASSSNSAAASTSSASSVRRDPNFSGVWLSTSHSNLSALLEAQGFSAANAARAQNAVVTQRINHSRRSIEVEVGGMVTRYNITGGWADEETDAETLAAAHAESKSADGDLSEAMLAKTAEWMGVPDRRRLVSSTGDLDTERTLIDDGQTMIVETTAHLEDKPDIVARTTFKRVQPAAADDAASTAPATAAGAR